MASSMKATTDVQRQFNAAIASADVTTILRMLDDPSLDLNARDLGHDLQTPLMRMCHMAVEVEPLEGVLGRLEMCAWNPNLQDATGRSLLMHACIADKIDVVDMCLANGCDVSLLDRDGNSAIIHAIRSGNESLLGSILDHEECLPLMTQTNNTGHTPIEVAQMEGHVTMVNRLSSLLPSQHTKSKRKSKGKGQNSTLTPRDRKFKRQDSLSHHILETNGLLPNTSRCPPSSCENDNTTNLTSRQKNLGDVTNRSQTNGNGVPHIQTSGSGCIDESAQTARMEMISGHVTEARGKRQKNSVESASKSQKTQRLLQRETDEGGEGADDTNNASSRNKRHAKQLLFRRKDSTSLPDLRDFKGKLVTSGEVTPADPVNTPFDQSESSSAGKEDEDVFTPKESYLEMYQKSGSSCSLPPLLSNSADSDRRKERGGHKHGRPKPPKKTQSHEEVMLRSLIV